VTGETVLTTGQLTEREDVTPFLSGIGDKSESLPTDLAGIDSAENSVEVATG
jgi:hypothetical protein